MAEENGSVSERYTSSMESIDSSRWVLQDDTSMDSIDHYNHDDDDDLPLRNGMDSEDEEDNNCRLIRTGPLIDSLDVETLEVSGAGQRNDFEVLY